MPVTAGFTIEGDGGMLFTGGFKSSPPPPLPAGMSGGGSGVELRYNEELYRLESRAAGASEWTTVIQFASHAP